MPSFLVRLFPLIPMIAVSGLIYLITFEGRECTSWWILRLKKMTDNLKQVHPILLGLYLLVMLFGLLWLVLQVGKIWPDTIKGLYVFCTANTAYVVISLWLDRIMSPLKYWFTVIKVVTSIAIGLSWLYFPEQIVYNLVGVMGAISFLYIFPALSFKHLLGLGVGMVVYDIVGVYVSGWIIEFVRGLTFVPPAVIIVPMVIQAVSAQVSTTMSNTMIIGLGDIIIGGIFLSSAKLYNAEKAAFVGYCFGILGALLLAILSNHSVPATMFIIPAMLFAIWLSVRYQRSEAMENLLK